MCQALPLLWACCVVLWDRYYYTAFARDVVRGCPPPWVRGIYDFAAQADLTFFFKAPLELCLSRIRSDRLEPKYFEAGMDLRLSPDPRESFRLFQQRLFEQYLWMSAEYSFRVLDATKQIGGQQQLVRRWVEEFIDASRFTYPRR